MSETTMRPAWAKFTFDPTAPSCVACGKMMSLVDCDHEWDDDPDFNVCTACANDILHLLHKPGDTAERGLVCFYCGESFSYVGTEPDAETIQRAVNHEGACPQNPYLQKISQLKADVELLTTKGTGAYWQEKFKAVEAKTHDQTVIIDSLLVAVAMTASAQPKDEKLLVPMSRELAGKILASRGIDIETVRVETQTEKQVGG